MEQIENCFLCFSKCDDCILLNSKNGIELNIKEMILKHFWIEIINEFSQGICSICWKNINNFHEFYIRIENVHKSHTQQLKIITADFIEYLPSTFDDYDINNKKTNNLTETLNLSVNQESSMTIREEVFITVPANLSDAHCDIENDAINYENHVDDIDHKVDGDNYINNDVNNQLDDSENYKALLPASRLAILSNKCKILASTKTKKTLTTSIKRIRKKKPSLKAKPDLTEQNEKLRRYFSLACELCEEQFTEFAEVKKHYRNNHDNEGYIKCCGSKFTEMWKAMQHYEWHENPEAFKCKICEKCFNDNYKLKLHIERSHTPASELKFDCDLCEKSFRKKYFLVHHKKVAHAREEDKIYKCDTCDTKFAVKGFLQAHIRRIHLNGCSRVCDICAKTFKCSQGYDYHYLVEHTNTHKVQCELCGMWVKHKESLKGHMLRIHRAFIKQSCQTCGKTCPNKKALSTHIREVHKFIEYPCTICEKSFKKKISLREHMAQHTGEKDLYKCLFCPRTFRSSANMYAHRKRAHPKEYEENRLLGNKYPDLQTRQ